MRNEEVFKVTEKAENFILENIKFLNFDPNALRVGLRGGGCTGFTYDFEFTRIIPDDSVVVTDILYKGKTIQIITDEKSVIFLKGSILDYESSLLKSGLVWRNPNQTSECSCGKSVSF